jgi:phosphate transport system substrate-binding protein
MKKALLSLLVVTLFVVSFAETLVIKGSNTVFPIAQLWIEELKESKPELNITLEGAGSSTGIAALLNGTTDVANSSRFMKSSEIEKMNENGQFFMPVVVGYDGIAIVVNKELGLDNITLDQLKSIYTGQIRTWNQLNSNLPNRPIIKYSRDTASGTYETFTNIALSGEKMDPTVKMGPSTQFEINQVSQNAYAIAYAGVGYVDDSVKVLTVEGVQPTAYNILNSVYPISRPLFVFLDVTDGFMTGNVKEYVNFGLSKKGQELVEKAGYVAAYGK